ncbi:MAG: hypothetical protein F4112_09485 [Holophagales bacterium]|nr:hypothetical protein [Holophagales bacterium]MYD21051.1 hypothetical protein [Holophagales bacterium]MYI33189.1 hypothetical protein [Holophagales bacterium]
MRPPETVPATSPRPTQILAAAAIGVAAALLVLRWMAPDTAPAASHEASRTAPAPLPARPEPEPPPPLPRELSDALDLMAQGRLREAQRLMLDFDASPAARELLPDHRETLSAMLERLGNDPVLLAAVEFEAGFEDADLDRLRRALGSLSRDRMIALRRDPQASRYVDDARRLTAEVDAIEGLLGSDRLAALRLAQDFARRHPRFAAGLAFEDRAAEAIEDTAGRLMTANRLEEARTLLLELKSLRGDAARETASVDVRLASIEAVFQRRSDLDAAIREIEVLGRQRPHEALEVLAAMERTPENRRRLAQVESTLKLLLDDLDQGGPVVEILAADGSSLDQVEYDRREDLVLLVRARDDYEVVSVRFFWRWFDRDGEGAVVEAVLGSVEPGMVPATDGAGDARTAEIVFEATVTQAEHGGRSLQFWAEATDRGGRVARSADPPKQLAPERRGFLQRLGLRRRQ